ncbi:hypothetical protein [Prochlorococcus sp. MIT 0604]|uniref:hypothetical protein n=1 Tax=Prochlorococcus sp. MIT 0604 TaxID=1501268 RepID=UPI0012E005A9|nr:hypothetical protein [Prochlorococcus sp. MIT 0604]
MTEIRLSIYSQEPFINLKNISLESVYDHIRADSGIKKYLFTTGETIKQKYNTSFYQLSGKSFSEILLCNEAGELVSYFSDRYGFNNPDIVWDNKKPSIVLLGDSFVHGHCQSNGNAIADLIRAKNPDLNVINLALSGNGPLSNLGVLSEYINDDILIKKIYYFHLEGNDLSRDLPSELSRKELLNYLDDRNQDLISKQKEINKNIINYTNYVRSLNLISKNNFFDFLNFTKLKKLLSHKFGFNNYAKENFEKVIVKLNNYCVKRKCKLTFISIPTYNSFIDKKYNLDERNYLKKLLNDNNIEFINLYRLFSNNKNPLENYFFMGSHLSDKGAKNTVSYIED